MNSSIYKKWVKRGRDPLGCDTVLYVQNTVKKLIKEAKLRYFKNLGNKLSDPKIGPKHFWTAFKKIANENKVLTLPQ